MDNSQFKAATGLMAAAASTFLSPGSVIELPFGVKPTVVPPGARYVCEYCKSVSKADERCPSCGAPRSVKTQTLPQPSDPRKLFFIDTFTSTASRGGSTEVAFTGTIVDEIESD